MNEISSCWTRIERSLTLLDPPVEERLPAGASSAALAELEARLAVPLPEGLRQSLACHDGTGAVALDELPALLSAAAIEREHQRLAGGVEGIFGPVPFRSEWIPIQEYGGVWILLDAARDGAAPPLICISVEERDAGTLSVTFEDMLRRAADALDALVPPEEEAGEAAVWSLRLIQALVSSGDLELLEDANPAALADRLDAVASEQRGGARAMAEALLDALVDAPEVDEVFADHADIAAALRSSLERNQPS
jgi:hypothetical protein